MNAEVGGDLVDDSREKVQNPYRIHHKNPPEDLRLKRFQPEDLTQDHQDSPNNQGQSFRMEVLQSHLNTLDCTFVTEAIIALHITRLVIKPKFNSTKPRYLS